MENVTDIEYNFIQRKFFGFLNENLPRKLKRLIFLSSLLAMIEDIKNPSDDIIKKLDELFKLANSNEMAIGFPMYIHSFIWQKALLNSLGTKENFRERLDTLVTEKLNSRDFRELCNFFYKSTPEWLKYGSKNLIENDLRILFKNMPTLLA